MLAVHSRDLLNRGKKTKGSPVSSLLSSNRAPTDSEVSVIQETISEIEKEVETLQGRLVSGPITPANQQAIYMRLSYLDHLLGSHKALLSSIRLFPTELIALIFLHFITENKDPMHNSSPWILGLVCRHWRQIALATPAIWKNLPPIRLRHIRNRAEITRLATLISTILIRSAGHPLSFYLENILAREIDVPILELLFLQNERWENVSLEISSSTKDKFSVIRGRLPSLRFLKLVAHNPSYGLLVMSMFEMAPKLREVSLACHVDFQVRMPWTQLTSFEEESTKVDRLSLALQFASDKLQNIRFTTNLHGLYSNYSGVDQITPVVLPRLKTLTFESFYYRRSLAGILDKLTLPALQIVVFRSFSRHNFGWELQSLITRSSCLIQSMTFHDIPIFAQLLPILDLTPCLTSLSINDPKATIIEALSSVRDGREWMMLPALHTLKIHLTDKWSHHKIILCLAQARCDLAVIDVQHRDKLKTLKTFKISFATNIDDLHDNPSYLELGSLGCETNFSDQVKALYTGVLALNRRYKAIPAATSTTVIGKVIHGFRGLEPTITMSMAILDALMSKLDELKVRAENVQMLYVSSIDYLLRVVVNESNLPFAQKIANRRLLEVLFKRWTPELVEAAPNLHWRWDDDGYLCYVPTIERSATLPMFRRTTLPLETLPASTEFYWPKIDPENTAVI